MLQIRNRNLVDNKLCSCSVNIICNECVHLRKKVYSSPIVDINSWKGCTQVPKAI